jgi:hypothetical protein
VRTPPASSNCDAYAERFVGSIKEECLDRVLPAGDWHLRGLVRDYVTHYLAERHHWGPAMRRSTASAAGSRVDSTASTGDAQAPSWLLLWARTK